MSETPTLLVLAAGMGSRYGGLKQLDAMGPAGETVLDYAVFDAIRAGFQRVVFVIRKDIESAFREKVGKRYTSQLAIDYAFQELEDLPAGHRPPEGRTKPWGTGHAIWTARHAVEGPFAVINADDFYGADAYRVMADYFKQCRDREKEPLSMVGYAMVQTLSPHGTVNRGLCSSSAGKLQKVEEIVGIRQLESGLIQGFNSTGKTVELSPQALVSMNFWGFSSDIFGDLERALALFLDLHGQTHKAEFYLPFFVDEQIQNPGRTCDLLQTSAEWFGVTYPEDKQHVQDRLTELVNNDQYPSPLSL